MRNAASGRRGLKGAGRRTRFAQKECGSLIHLARLPRRTGDRGLVAMQVVGSLPGFKGEARGTPHSAGADFS